MSSDVDVVVLDMDTLTAHCSDGVTRAVHEMYDEMAEKTEDPDDAIAVIIKVDEDSYIVCSLADGITTAH